MKYFNFCIKNDTELPYRNCIKNDTACVKSDTACIKNDTDPVSNLIQDCIKNDTESVSNLIHIKEYKEIRIKEEDNKEDVKEGAHRNSVVSSTDSEVKLKTKEEGQGFTGAAPGLLKKHSKQNSFKSKICRFFLPQSDFTPFLRQLLY